MGCEVAPVVSFFVDEEENVCLVHLYRAHVIRAVLCATQLGAAARELMSFSVLAWHICHASGYASSSCLAGQAGN